MIVLYGWLSLAWGEESSGADNSDTLEARAEVIYMERCSI